VPGEADLGAGLTLVRIVAYEPRHRDAFRDLNLAWIIEYFEVEGPDRWLLDDPHAHILRHGGHILMAEMDGEVVGTCALIRESDDTFELAKMAVAPTARGRGVGRALGAAAIEKARSLGARRVELLSNTVLEPAIQLYRSLGFVEAPMTPTEYRRANIRMILDLPLSPAR
jgi:GNAT superfamily N-acetyltransferase